MISVPNFSNQTPQGGFTFTEAAEYSDSKPLFRLKLKRRYVDGGVDTYDDDWQTISSYVLKEGLGDIVYGVDDQQWITGVTKIGALDLRLDNTERKFNSYSDTSSFWYDSATTYYLANSLIELDLGFELPTGTQYYADKPFHSGLLRQDSLKYNIKNNTVDFSVFSKLDYLKSVNIYEAFSITANPAVSAINLTDKIYTYVNENSPDALSITCSTNFLRNDIYYPDITDVNENAYQYLQSIARQTGSLFGIGRDNNIYMTYFNAGYYQDTKTSFIYDSDTSNYYSCAESSKLSDWIDSGTSSRDLTIETGTSSITNGKFGTGGRSIVADLSVESINSAWVGDSALTVSANDMSFEALFKFRRLYNYYHEFDDYIWFYQDGYSSQPIVNIGNIRFTSEKCFNLRPYDSDTQVPTYKKSFNFGENQWYYLAAVNDTVNDEVRTYINGNLIYTKPVSVSSALTTILLGPWYRGTAEMEFDSVKLSTKALSEDDILNNKARIFGNKYQWQSTATYDFYNYGVNQNILGVMEYDSGYTNIYNKVIIPNEGLNTYKTQFTYIVISESVCELQVGSKMIRNYDPPLLSPTTFDISYASTALKEYINDGIGDIGYCTLTTDNEYSIYLTIDEATAKKSSFSAGYFPQVGTAETFSAVSPYAACWRTTNFMIDNTPEDYIYQNTSSVYEYGVKNYTLENADNITNELTQTATIANNILDNSSDPKIRMRIRATYLAGDLDLFDRVTVNWRQDSQDASLHWGDSLDAWGEDSWGDFAGQITWETKDFWIIGITHSFNNQESIYTLKEV